MFKLLRLAIYGLVGFTLYTFVMDVLEARQKEEPSPAPRKRGGSRGGAVRAANPITGAKRGGGTGKPVETHDPDGGTTRHRVGRGVI